MPIDSMNTYSLIFRLGLHLEMAPVSLETGGVTHKYPQSHFRQGLFTYAFQSHLILGTSANVIWAVLHKDPRGFEYTRLRTYADFFFVFPTKMGRVAA